MDLKRKRKKLLINQAKYFSDKLYISENMIFNYFGNKIKEVFYGFGF